MILLGILKIIGIILLILLGLLLFLLLLLLFCPFSYSLSGHYDSSRETAVRIGWLFHLIGLEMKFLPDGVKKKSLRILVFQKNLRSSDEKNAGKGQTGKKERIDEIEETEGKEEKEERAETEETERKEEKEERAERTERAERKLDSGTEIEIRITPETKPSSVEKLLDENQEDPGLATQSTQGEKACPGLVTQSIPEEESGPGLPAQGTPVEKEESGDGRASFLKKTSNRISEIKSKIKEILYKIKDMPDRIKALYHGIEEKIQKGSDRYRNWRGFYEDYGGKEALSRLFREVIRLLKGIWPKKIILSGRFCCGKPDLTGQALGILCLIPAAYRYQWRLYPDFEGEKAYVAADCLIKGRLFLFRVAGTVLRILFDSQCRKAWHRYQQIKK